MQRLLEAQMLSNRTTIASIAVSKCLGDMIECAGEDDPISQTLFEVELAKFTKIANELSCSIEQTLLRIEEYLNDRTKNTGL